MYFQLVDNQVLLTQGQPDVFNLHRLTACLRRGLGPFGEEDEGDLGFFVASTVGEAVSSQSSGASPPPPDTLSLDGDAFGGDDDGDGDDDGAGDGDGAGDAAIPRASA